MGYIRPKFTQLEAHVALGMLYGTFCPDVATLNRAIAKLSRAIGAGSSKATGRPWTKVTRPGGKHET